MVGLLGCQSEAVDFNHDVRPILNEKCVACHGGVKRQGELSLLFRDDALAGGESGEPAIVPGAPGRSQMIRLVSHPDPDERMPREGAPLTGAEITTLRRWIEQGAAWADHWAYVKPEAPVLPGVSDPGWPLGGIDRFVLARLDEAALTSAPQADCPTLLRRVSLDLIGLPPTLEAVDVSCADGLDASYEPFVDSLLASPQFGERWAALWLDLARYADSQGYEKDGPRTIWRYRDWVIDAFNADMPFDQFTIEQLAGDLLPEPTEEQRLATAFHRNTMTNDEGGTDDEEFRIAAVIDRVNTTWEVWQGTTFSCVQCHGHPYDPFRHEDYYRFLAFFNNTADVDRTDEWPTLPSFETESEAEGKALAAELERLRAQIDSLAAAPDLVAERRAWEERLRDTIAVRGVPPKFEGRVVPLDVLRILKIDEAERDEAERMRIHRHYAALAPSLEPLRKEQAEAAGDLNELQPVRTPVLRELPEGERRATHVFERGNYLTPGDEVEPGVPASMLPFPDDAPRNRLGVAQWLVSPENPLTARVTVNRFWEQLFGTGLVETLEDSGTQGLPPSHPELLDWLALRFMHEHAWSVKALLKEIVTSATYRQASTLTPEKLEHDPQNRLLARGPRVRLTAEQLRDQALFTGGLLSAKMHGPSVMPPQPDGLWRNPYSGLQWTTSEGEDRYRRALYTYWRRTVPHPLMTTFDAPTREVCVSRRVRTNTPLQALLTLNDPAFVEAAAALARRMRTEAPDTTTDARLRHGYRLALLTGPDDATLADLHTLYDEALIHYRSRPADADSLAGTPTTPEHAALTVVANSIMNLDAFLTKN